MINNLNVWQINNADAISILSEINTELSEILKKWDPSKKYKIYKARYRYGDLILDQGKLQLPLERGGVVDFDSPQVEDKLKIDLSYSSFPIGIILNNSAEVFFELDSRIVPLALFQKGIPLGLLETLEGEGDTFCFKNVWSVSAGARTAFMLPKISDKAFHAKIQRELGCTSLPPQSPLEHVPVFIDIANKINENNPWYVDILFFSSAWFEENVKDINYLRFYYFLQGYLIKYSGFSRNKPTIDLIWDLCSQALNKKKKRVNQAVFDKMKNLIIGMLGVSPMYGVAMDTTSGPYNQIQKIYKDIYGVSSAPAIMEPCHLNIENIDRPLYFSLKYQNTFDIGPNKSSESLITDLVQLYSVMGFFMELVGSGELRLETTIIDKILKSITYKFYHSAPEKYPHINNTSSLTQSDPRLSMILGENTLYDFAYTNIFLRSCIQIIKK